MPDTPTDLGKCLKITLPETEKRKLMSDEYKSDESREDVESASPRKHTTLTKKVLACMVLLVLICMGCVVVSLAGIIWPKADGNVEENSAEKAVISVTPAEIRVDFKTSTLTGTKPQQTIEDLEHVTTAPVPRRINKPTSYTDTVRDRLVDIGVLPSKFLLDYYERELMKYTFPDIDYALLGYNILKGYPMSIGSDPGFTLPIFRADYSEGRQTADLRYNIPKGLVIIPDVACKTSFSSRTIKSKTELQQSSSMAFGLSAGGWGASFSANAKFEQKSKSLASGESIIIQSQAKCQYYFMKLLENTPPPFDPSFLQWIFKLNATEDKDIYLEFIDTYGTHILTEVVFGATYIYQYTMSKNSSLHKTMTEGQLEVAAGYSGLVQLGASFGMNARKKQKAEDFEKSVTTEVITEGSTPPANGDASMWASTVKDDPVPVSLKVESIDTLFTEAFMGDLGVHYKKILATIKANKPNYCPYYVSRSSVAGSCEESKPGIPLNRRKLVGNLAESSQNTRDDCITKCIHNKDCIAVSYCTHCTSVRHRFYQTCFMLMEDPNKVYYIENDDDFESFIFIPEMRSQIRFNRASLTGENMELAKKMAESPDMCSDWCLYNINCVGYTFRRDEKLDANCKIYSESGITGMSIVEESETVFLSYHSRHAVPTKKPPEETMTYLLLNNTLLHGNMEELKGSSKDNSRLKCPEDTQIVQENEQNGKQGLTCYKLQPRTKTRTVAVADPGSQAIVLLQELTEQLPFANTRVTNNTDFVREFNFTMFHCQKVCFGYPACSLISFHNYDRSEEGLCRVYDGGSTIELEEAEDWVTVVINRNLPLQAPTTAPSISGWIFG